jgi:uncharacterized protein with von Willebrand factor type A (vWA) domain
LLGTTKKQYGLKNSEGNVTVEDVTLEFVMELDGEKFYQYENAFEVPSNRFLVAQHAIFQHDLWRMSTETVKDLLSRQLKAITEGDLQEAVKINVVMDRAIDLDTSMDAMYDLASYYYVLEGEDPTKYEKEYQRKKKDIWRKNPEQANFFLSSLLKRIATSPSSFDPATAISLLKKNEDHQLLESLLRGT